MKNKLSKVIRPHNYDWCKSLRISTCELDPLKLKKHLSTAVIVTSTEHVKLVNDKVQTLTLCLILGD